MEVITGAVHAVFPLGDASRIGEARRYAARLSAEMAWDAVDAGRLSVVVTELGTNLQRHARDGMLLVAAYPEAGEVEVLAIDRGPGLADPALCMTDGFSTGGTAGTGLGAVRRLSQDFDLYSSVPQGTVVVARLRKDEAAGEQAHAIMVRGISVAAPGETACGDAWAACLDGDQATLIVADGLGHGPDAAVASHAALDVFRAHPFADLREGIQAAHARLRTTRGAAVCSLALDTAAGTVRSAGAGNVFGRVISGVSDRSLLTQHGTVGVQIRRVDEAVQDWPPHALVVAFTDGLESRWSAELILAVLGRDPSLAAALLFRDHCRGRDDATVVVMRRRD